MRVNEILREDQQIDELLGGVGRAIGRGLGGLAKGYGYVAGIPKAMSAASQRGRAASMANIGYGKFAEPEETPIYQQELEKRLGTGGTNRVADIQKEIQRLQGLLAAAQNQGGNAGSTTGSTSTPPQVTGSTTGTQVIRPPATSGSTAGGTKTAGYNYKTSIPTSSTTGKYSGYSSTVPTGGTPNVKYNTSSGLLKPGSAAKPAAASPAAPATGTDFAAKRAAGAAAAQSAMTSKTDDDLLNMFKARKSAPSPASKTSTKFSEPKPNVSATMPPAATPPVSTAPASVPVPQPGKQLSDKPENVRRREKRAELNKPKQAVKQVASGANWSSFPTGNKVLERRNLKER